MTEQAAPRTEAERLGQRLVTAADLMLVAGEVLHRHDDLPQTERDAFRTAAIAWTDTVQEVNEELRAIEAEARSLVPAPEPEDRLRSGEIGLAKPCARYWGSDGTLCSTHDGWFAEAKDNRCDRAASPAPSASGDLRAALRQAEDERDMAIEAMALVVLAAGGTVAVSRRSLIEDAPRLSVEQDPLNNRTIYRAALSAEGAESR